MRIEGRPLAREIARVHALPILRLLPMLAVLLFAGTDQVDAAEKSAPAPAPASEARKPATASLDAALALWKMGDHDAAVAQFLAVDFRRRPLFPAGSSMAYTEKEFAGLPAATRERVHQEILAQSHLLKLLGARVRDLGKAALQAGKPSVAEQHLGALQRCGDALETPDALTLLQLIGKGFRKAADRATAPDKPTP